MKKFHIGDWTGTYAPELGGNLCRLFWGEAAILHSLVFPEQWLSAPANYGIPILFPPNRIEDGIVPFGDKFFSLPVNEPARGNHLHGLALTACWQVCKEWGNGFRMRWAYTRDDARYIQYPFACKLELGYEDSVKSNMKK